jgi:hypothetical protein
MPPAECVDCDYKENSRLLLEGLHGLQDRTARLEDRINEICEKQREWADTAHHRLEEICKSRHEINALRFEKLDRDARDGLVKLKVWGAVVVLIAGACCSAAASWVFSLLK